MLYFLKFPDLTIGRKCKQPTCMFNIYKIYFYFMFVNVSKCMYVHHRHARKPEEDIRCLETLSYKHMSPLPEQQVLLSLSHLASNYVYSSITCNSQKLETT